MTYSIFLYGKPSEVKKCVHLIPHNIIDRMLLFFKYKSKKLVADTRDPLGLIVKMIQSGSYTLPLSWIYCGTNKGPLFLVSFHLNFRGPSDVLGDFSISAIPLEIFLWTPCRSKSRSHPDSKQKTQTEVTFWSVLLDCHLFPPGFQTENRNRGLDQSHLKCVTDCD